VALVPLLPHPHLTARVVTAGSWLSFRALASDAAYTGEETEAAAQAHGMRLMVVKRPEGSHGFVLLPRRWVVERSFA
jgi:transposase